MRRWLAGAVAILGLATGLGALPQGGIYHDGWIDLNKNGKKDGRSATRTSTRPFSTWPAIRDGDAS